MFGPAAHLYVYFTYGMHHCANVVTEADGVAGAVLLRAASVHAGVDIVASRRGENIAMTALLRGPGNLCRGLGITRADNGVDLLDPASRVRIEQRIDQPPIAVTTRVGVRLAADQLLRFTWRGDPAVSSPAPRDLVDIALIPDKRKGPD
jgi:DNA-3-methyladenine glycosylase